MIDRQVIINSYLKEISTINELMTNVETQMASLAIKDKRVDLLLGFTGIDYYGALLLLYEIGITTIMVMRPLLAQQQEKEKGLTDSLIF